MTKCALFSMSCINFIFSFKKSLKKVEKRDNVVEKIRRQNCRKSRITVENIVEKMVGKNRRPICSKNRRKIVNEIVGKIVENSVEKS